MAQLKEGDRAPSFRLTDQRGNDVALEDLRSTRTVLYFFPKADTGGWTTEARQFDERLPQFEQKKVRVVGMSPDPQAALESFCGKYGLKLTFLSDPDHRTLEAYGAWGERPGRDPGVIRSTVVIAPDGRIEHAWYGVKPDGHADEVLAAL